MNHERDNTERLTVFLQDGEISYILVLCHGNPRFYVVHQRDALGEVRHSCWQIGSSCRQIGGLDFPSGSCIQINHDGSPVQVLATGEPNFQPLPRAIQDYLTPRVPSEIE